MKQFLLIGLITLASCTHYLQPDKNISALLDKCHTDAIGIYNGTDYSYNDEKYQFVSDELDLLLSADQHRINSKPLVEIDVILIKGFNARRTYHKSNIITDKKVWDEERRYMQGYFTPRLKAEQSINNTKK